MKMFHPSKRHLHRFADRDGTPRDLEPIARHLRECQGCRTILQGIRSLGERARRMDTGAPRPEVWDRIRNTVANGETPILPAADPRIVHSSWRVPASLAAGLTVVAGLAWMVFASSELQSEASDLRFAPGRPVSGEQINVRYRAVGTLADQDRLRLRALYRRAGDSEDSRAVEHTEVALLTRRDDNTFHGTFRLPPDVVFAAFAVEDKSAAILDSHGRIGWELLTYTDGLPLYDALLQRVLARLAIGDLAAGLMAAQVLTASYPEVVEGWVVQSGLEQRALGPTAFDSLRANHLARVRHFDRALATSRNTEQVAWEYFYALTWGDEARTQHWLAKLRELAPDHRFVVQLLVLAIVGQSADETPGAKLAALDSLRYSIGQAYLSIAQEGYRVAVAAGHTADVKVWVDRLLTLQPWTRPGLADELSDQPTTRTIGIELLEEELRSQIERGENDRFLYQTRRLHHAYRARQRRRLIGALAEARVATGDTAGGRVLIDSVVSVGWDLRLFQIAADLREEAGDLQGAVEMLALVSVDPTSGDGNQLRAQALQLSSPRHWEEQLAIARRRMIAETFEDERRHPLSEAVRVVDLEADRPRDLRDLLRGQVSVVAVWHPYCTMCESELVRLQGRLARLEGARLVVVALGSPSQAAIDRLRTGGLTARVVIDTHGDVPRTFGIWGARGTFVLDESGMVRFAFSASEDVPRQVVALQTGTPQVAE